MQTSRIEWCDSTWNPVTGCLNGCEYCYARKIAERFKGCDKWSTYAPYCQATWHRVNPDSEYKDALFVVEKKCPPINVRYDAKKGYEVHTTAPYPWGFQPTFREDRLDEPEKHRKPKNIFVCSMADLFGGWVPDEWIMAVFDACKRAPQHRYMFLTRNPIRYGQLMWKNRLPRGDNMWYGTTVTGWKEMPDAFRCISGRYNAFVSMEPMLGQPSVMEQDYAGIKWIIMGAETGNRKGKVAAKEEWVKDATGLARDKDMAIYMKDSLISVVGEENMIREFPWERK